MLQPTNELCAGIDFVVFFGFMPRQQHAGLDLCERRRHYQIFSCQFKAHDLNGTNIFHVLPGYLTYVYIQNVHILAPYEIQQ